MSGGSRGISRSHVIVLALLVASASGVTLGLGGSASVADAADDARATEANPVASNNTTVHHRNPNEVEANRSRGDVERYLTREMMGRLARSVNLSEVDPERARKLVGNDSKYEELKRKYANVSNDSAASRQRIERLGRVAETQQAFFAAVERYRRTHREYRESRGDQRRERRLAHELERLADAVNRTGTTLDRRYANLSSETRFDFGEQRETVADVRANVTQTQMEVRNESLVRTRLSVRAVEPRGSFAEPVVLAGRLEAANGTPVADENVTLRIGNGSVQTDTGADGRFRVQYRPTVLRTGERPRTVAFRPTNASAYAGANATVRLVVEQVEPTIRISNRSERVGYGETLAVEGSVAVGDVGASAVPLVLTLGGVPVGRTHANADGSYEFETRAPTNVSAGRRELGVRLAQSGRALAATSANALVTVESTPTSLSVDNVSARDAQVFVVGRLVAGDGSPLENQTVQLRVNGTTVGTATTDETGGYADAVRVPSRLANADAVRVTAAYSGDGTSFESARKNRTLTLATASARPGGSWGTVGVAGLLGVAGVGALLARRLVARDGRSRSVEASDEADTGLSATRRWGDDARATSRDAAVAHLDDGAFDLAAVAAYATARRALEADAERPAARTHREFLAVCSDAAVSDEQFARLERLTDLYERARFSPARISADDAEEAVELATAFDPGLSGGVSRDESG